MADEYKFPMRLRTVMAQAAVVLRNSSSDHYRELDEDMQCLVRRTLDELDAACIEANLAAPTWYKKTEGASAAAAGVSHSYAHSLADLQAEASEKYGMALAETLAAAQALYERNLISYPHTAKRHLPEFMFDEAASIIRSYQMVTGNRQYDPEYQAPCWTRHVDDIHAVGIFLRAMPSAALFGVHMSDAETRVYGLVHARFLSLFVRPVA
jgi:DNA topoisomerase IA